MSKNSELIEVRYPLSMWKNLEVKFAPILINRHSKFDKYASKYLVMYMVDK